MREPGFEPSVPAAAERTGILPTGFTNISRHTGACGFVWSSTQDGEYGLLSQA
jgi:hypothetical protein